MARSLRTRQAVRLTGAAVCLLAVQGLRGSVPLPWLMFSCVVFDVRLHSSPVPSHHSQSSPRTCPRPPQWQHAIGSGSGGVHSFPMQPGSPQIGHGPDSCTEPGAAVSCRRIWGAFMSLGYSRRAGEPERSASLQRSFVVSLSISPRQLSARNAPHEAPRIR